MKAGNWTVTKLEVHNIVTQHCYTTEYPVQLHAVRKAYSTTTTLLAWLQDKAPIIM